MTKLVLGIALAAGLFAAGCGDVSVPDHPDPLDHRPEGGATEELHVQTKDVKFTRTELTARAGVPTELTLENLDDVEHDFQIDELDVEVLEGGAEHDGGHDSGGDLAVHTEGGETDTVTFVVNEPGTYEFYCTVSGHKDAGMVGTLVVQ